VHPALEIPPLLVAPFAVLLLCIAVLPLRAAHFWESNRNKGLVVGLVSIPVAGWLVAEAPELLMHSALEYVSFIALLGSLFVVTGGIHVSGDLLATPRTNVALLGAGAVLANLIGTTGASMVLIRLVLRTNSERKNTRHIPFFFILLVSNVGGLLTPLGDPPLFLGYLRGVPFFWTLQLLPIWLGGVAYLLLLLFLIDRRAYAAEPKVALQEDLSHLEPMVVSGRINLVLLVGIVAAVFLPSPLREATMLSMAALSLVVGRPEPRQKNEFAFGPIYEVAVLFAGIFVTMIPALELLRGNAQALGLRASWQFFWVTGALSSVLDNAPTYLTFLATAQGLDLAPEVVGIPAAHLLAISAGSVLMGANTYIGNGPNFMVKAIADSQGYATDNFATYAFKATCVLLPVYGFVTIWLTLR
jgi:Na+/H+ antiporter NhaD/arsenite permease-like protein